jgi:glycosyltransferase involved in cell wall biosynthesis
MNDWRKVVQCIDGVTLIFVDDCSVDKTANLLASLTEAIVIKTPKNLGKARAIKFGMDYAIKELGVCSDDWLGFLDADSAFKFEDIKRICSMAQDPLFQDFAGIWASRVKLLGRSVSRNEMRHYISRFVITFLSIGIKDFPYDSQAGFKLFRAKFLLAEIDQLIIKTRWFIDLEIWTYLKLKFGHRILIWEEPVHSWSEVEDSRIRIRAIPSIVKEVLVVRRMLQERIRSR